MKNISVNIEQFYPELKRIKYMMRWYRKSKNNKTKIKVVKHCVKIANSFKALKFKVKVLRN